jgi:hypothetical protein
MDDMKRRYAWTARGQLVDSSICERRTNATYRHAGVKEANHTYARRARDAMVIVGMCGCSAGMLGRSASSTFCPLLERSSSMFKLAGDEDSSARSLSTGPVTGGTARCVEP